MTWTEHHLLVHDDFLRLVLTPSVSTTSTLPFASSSICLWILRIASKLRMPISSLHSGSSMRQKSGETESYQYSVRRKFMDQHRIVSISLVSWCYFVKQLQVSLSNYYCNRTINLDFSNKQYTKLGISAYCQSWINAKAN